MPGQSVRIFDRTEFDLSKFKASLASNWIYLAKTIPIAQWREINLAIRVHSVQIALGNAEINFGLFNSAPTEEEPGIDFLDGGTTGAVTPNVQEFLNLEFMASRTWLAF